MRRLLALWMVAILGATVASGRTAQAATSVTISLPGTVCQPYQGYGGNWLYGEPGSGNPNYSAVWTLCPVPWNLQTEQMLYPDVQELVVNYSDQNSSASLSCYVYGTTPQLGYYWSSSLLSCTVSGGCLPQYPEPGYTGQNYLFWTAPLNGGRSMPASTTFGVACNLPPMSTYASWVIRVGDVVGNCPSYNVSCVP